MPSPSSDDYEEPLDARVLRSLTRLELSRVPVTDLGDGVIKLDLSRLGSNDRCMAVASIRCIPGVTEVVP